MLTACNQVALQRLFSVAAGFSLRLHRLGSLCHLLTAIWNATRFPGQREIMRMKGKT
jgi:hypothetical protein